MTAASGIGRPLATWLSCARSPSTSYVTAEQPRSACGRVASRLPGMMSTCCLYWLDDFMRRPWDRPVVDQGGGELWEKGIDLIDAFGEQIASGFAERAVVVEEQHADGRPDPHLDGKFGS